MFARIAIPPGPAIWEVVLAVLLAIGFAIVCVWAAGRVFRIGHLGSLTDVMALSGIATAEMCMADLGLDITLGSGVAAAQEVYRAHSVTGMQKDAA